MKKKRIILVITLLLLLMISGCSGNNISQRLIEKYNIRDNNLFLMEVIQNLYSDTDVLPIVYREQEGADEIFNLMNIEDEYLESYAFLYDIDKPEYILIMRAEIFSDEFVLSGIDNLVFDMLEKDSNAMDNVVFSSIGDFLVFIKHNNAEGIFAEIEKAMKKWDSNEVTPIL